METPQNRLQHDVALFRFGLIADIMAQPPRTGQRELRAEAGLRSKAVGDALR